MSSVDVRASYKINTHVQQLGARLFLSVVVVMSWSSRCLMTPARAETVVPHNGFISAGFHQHRPPFLRWYRDARSCDPVVTCKRFKRWECRTPRRAVQGVDGDAGALVDARPLRNVIVTGANRGLGFAIADHMLDIGGYRVVLACRSQQEVC